MPAAYSGLNFVLKSRRYIMGTTFSPSIYSRVTPVFVLFHFGRNEFFGRGRYGDCGVRDDIAVGIRQIYVLRVEFYPGTVPACVKSGISITYSARTVSPGFHEVMSVPSAGTNRREKGSSPSSPMSVALISGFSVAAVCGVTESVQLRADARRHDVTVIDRAPRLAGHPAEKARGGPARRR